jgi:hypothetical protein
MSFENGLTTALAGSCCLDGRVNQSSLRPNITTRRPGAASCRAGGSRHSDLEAAGRGRPTVPILRASNESGQIRKDEMMLTRSVLIFVVAMTAASVLPGTVRADEALPNLSGRFRCEPQPAPCRSGEMFTVTQIGDQIEFKSDNGLVGNAKLTSWISLSGLPPWNSLG